MGLKNFSFLFLVVKMVCSSASRLFQRSAAPARAFLRTKSSPSVASGASNSGGGLPHTIPAPPSCFSRPQKPFFRTRLPVELASGESLIPLHSATASSLLRSMLSSKVGQWGFLSEGFATPL